MNAYFLSLLFWDGEATRPLYTMSAISDDFDFVPNENEKLSFRDVYTTLRENNLWYTVVKSKLNDISNAFLEDLRKKLKHQYTTTELMTLLQDMKTIHTVGLEAFAKSYCN